MGREQRAREAKMLDKAVYREYVDPQGRAVRETVLPTQYQHADGSWRDYPPEGFDENVLSGFEVEVKAFGFITAPGEPGWVDPDASPEVQAEQLAVRQARAAAWTEEAMAREEELERIEKEQGDGLPL